MGILSLFGKSSSLYFPGCVTYFKFKESFELYKSIFSRLGIDFKVIDKMICCGLPALEAGYESESRKIMRKNMEIFKEEGVTDIITNSPCCYKMFLIDYANMMPDWNTSVKSIWNLILDKLEKNQGLIKNKASETVVYADNCYLGRYCGIYEEPRKILKLIGYELKETFDSKEESFCCGSCGGLPRANPELADKIAKEKISQAKRAGSKKIITGSFNDYELLKRNSEGSGVEVAELSEVLALALGINTRSLNKKFSESKENPADLKSEEELKNSDSIEEEK
jgi:Fe-S oxidoreductase